MASHPPPWASPAPAAQTGSRRPARSASPRQGEARRCPTEVAAPARGLLLAATAGGRLAACTLARPALSFCNPCTAQARGSSRTLPGAGSASASALALSASLVLAWARTPAPTPAGASRLRARAPSCAPQHCLSLPSTPATQRIGIYARIWHTGCACALEPATRLTHWSVSPATPCTGVASFVCATHLAGAGGVAITSQDGLALSFHPRNTWHCVIPACTASSRPSSDHPPAGGTAGHGPHFSCNPPPPPTHTALLADTTLHWSILMRS
ncbi:MAG: hypothetical protein J3K34DRAFT_439728 [Monoraphidium minutum]|nr:MAG: hypothetical protein J3K34DRAFT_439728 [Monoraphidium minutum]